MNETETAQSINDRAARWVARIDHLPLDQAAQDELDDWLAGDDRRRGAFFRAEAAWAMLDRASAVGTGARDDCGPPVAEFGPSRRRLIWSGGAAAACLVGGYGLQTLWRNRPLHIETALGEIRRVPLADGSLVAVNTATKLTVDLKPKIRNLHVDEGEAWFQVAKDRQRPFVVSAGNVRIRAVGTAFSVRRHDTGADVQVTEGAVEAWSIDREHEISRISAGSRTFVSDVVGPAQPIEASVDIDRALAWRSGQLIFDGNSLGAAAAEFNRYNAIQLRIDDPDLAREQVVGRFRTNEPDAFARSAGILLGVHAEMSNDQIVLSRR